MPRLSSLAALENSKKSRTANASAAIPAADPPTLRGANPAAEAPATAASARNNQPWASVPRPSSAENPVKNHGRSFSNAFTVIPWTSTQGSKVPTAIPAHAANSGTEYPAVNAINDGGMPVRADNGMVRRPYLDEVLDGLGVRHERLVDPDPNTIIDRGIGGQGNDVVRPNMVEPPPVGELQATLDRGPVLLPTDGHMRVATGYREVNGRTYVTVVESQGNPPFEQLIPYDTLRTTAKWWDARLILR